MGFLTKLDTGIERFKSAFIEEGDAYFTRMDDGTPFYNYESVRFGVLGALGIGNEHYKPVENLKWYYHNTLFLQDCINLYADFASQGKIMELDARGNEVENSKYIEFLRNPNVWQNGTEFIKELVINVLTSGISVQYGNFFKNGNIRVNPQLYNVDFNNLLFPKIKDKYTFNRRSIEELTIYEQLADNKRRSLQMYELAYFYDTVGNYGFGKKGYDGAGFFNPMARLFSIQSSLHTLINSQSTMAYLSGNNVNKIVSKDAPAGQLAPLSGDQKNDIEMKLNGRGQYGARAGKVGDTIASNETLKVLDLTRDHKKMQMVEMQNNAKENVRNCFLIPKDFFGDSTYENKQFSEARFVLGNVKPILDSWLSELTNKSTEYFSNGNRLVVSFDHIPSIIETKKQLENKGFKDRTSALVQVIDAFNRFKEIEPQVKWDDFLIRHQFNDFLKAE